MNYLLEKRFTALDSSMIAAASILLSQGKMGQALIAIAIFAAISLIADAIYGKRKKRDQQWQQLLDQERRVDAIKLYRAMYNVGLKEAKEATDAYRAKHPR